MNWKPIPGFEGYVISDTGIVKHGERIMTPVLLSTGRFKYSLIITPGKTKQMKRSRLVALTFLGPQPAGKPCVCHKNGVATDDRVENLYWGSYKENSADARKHGTMAIGERNGHAVLTKEKVIEIKALRKGGVKLKEIGDKFNITDSHVHNIITGRIWKHV